MTSERENGNLQGISHSVMPHKFKVLHLLNVVVVVAVFLLKMCHTAIIIISI